VGSEMCIRDRLYHKKSPYAWDSYPKTLLNGFVASAGATGKLPASRYSDRASQPMAIHKVQLFMLHVNITC